MPEQQKNPCACGCGELVTGTWKRGHAARHRARQAVRPLTAEEIDSADDVIDLGEIPFPVEEAESSRSAPDAPASPSGADPEPDIPPAHARKDWRKRTPGRPPKTLKITAGLRADIAAKISMPLEIGGRIWQARDSLCGGVFVDQRPDIADALTDIICDSADLVAFFTGPGGGFMKYLNLGAALWPVIEVVGAHHVYHSIEVVEDPNQPQMQGQYAA